MIELQRDLEEAVGKRCELNDLGKNVAGGRESSKSRHGKVVAIARAPGCVVVLWDGLKTRQTWALAFLRLLD